MAEDRMFHVKRRGLQKPPGIVSLRAVCDDPRLHRLVSHDARPFAPRTEKGGRHVRLADPCPGAGYGDERAARSHEEAIAVSARSIWLEVCPAVAVRRRREVPSGTVGGRMGNAKTPFSPRLLEMRTAA